MIPGTKVHTIWLVKLLIGGIIICEKDLEKHGEVMMPREWSDKRRRGLQQHNGQRKGLRRDSLLLLRL